MTVIRDTSAMLQGRVRGGTSNAKGVLLYTDRAWGASRIEEDGTTTTAGGALASPRWLGPLRSFVLFRRARAAAHRFWRDGTSGSNRVTMLHGAEHMCAACLDEGEPLTRKAVSRYSPRYPRRGTSVVLVLCALGTFVHVALGLLLLLAFGAVAVARRLSVAEPDTASLDVAMASGRALMAADCAAGHASATVIDLTREELIAA